LQPRGGLILVDTTYTNPVKTLSLAVCYAIAAAARTSVVPHHSGVAHLWLMTWLSYLNGSLYISVEISGFTGTETRGQLNFAAFLSALGSPGVARGTLAMFNYDETRTLGTINVPALVICGGSATLLSQYAHGITSSRTRYLTARWTHGIDGAEPAVRRSCQYVQCRLFVTQQVVLQNFPPINFPLIIR